jgi:endonuclease VIII
LRRMPEVVICDALLDQDVFAGVGNIIKNEVLYRVRVHPLSAVGDIPVVKLREIIAQARQYSFEFLAWRRASVLRQNLLVHGKGSCPSCGRKLSRAWLGKRKRRSFFCEHCQLRHGPAQGSAGARRTTKTRGKARAKAKAKPEAKSNSKGKAKAKAKAKTKTTARFGRNTS